MSKTANITEFLNSKKVELSSDVAELANFADIETQIKRAKENYSVLMGLINNVYNSKQELKKNGSKLLELIDRPARELKSDMDDFIKRVKDLGVNPDELKQPKEYQKAIDEIQKLYVYINQSYKESVN